ncbi:MAG TPA: SAM-dependent methyltransferase [Gemmatimonadaceae bacterium]|nr:SAM-dependent methyltransferase [Gemmatimonadaceae bacterium]
MKGDRPSRTAHFVALGRALADLGISHVADFHDPTARGFLNEKGGKSLANIERRFRAGKRSMRLEMARGMADTIGLRTVAIDRAVRDAVAGGAKQVVLLGAGYDGRAWRMRELTGVKVFEVDHPATQGDKRRRLPERLPAMGIVTFVSMDFERESLDTVLERAGHDRSQPTCWIWEGVVMYLTHEAMRATLVSVAERSAPGSTLIVNYHTVHRRFIARLMFRLIGEPQISAWTPQEMAADVRSVGFLVGEDSGMADWNKQFAQGQAKVEQAHYMRIAIARK